MEQYELAPNIIHNELVYCVTRYPLDSIFVRRVGSKGGNVKVNENLSERRLAVEENKQGLKFFIDKKERYLFEKSESFPLSFSIAYLRYPDPVTKVISMLSSGINPDDPSLPEVEKSIFRAANLTDYIEIGFKGKIPLIFHSWRDEPYWKYWQVDRSKKCNH